MGTAGHRPTIPLYEHFNFPELRGWILSSEHVERRRGGGMHALMRVHPIRASDRRIIIELGVTRRDRRRLWPGKAVLRPGRQLALPMDDGGCAGLILKIDVKALAGRE